MRIVYDYQIFAAQEFGGISRYFVELAAGLASRNENEVSLLAPLHVNHYLRDQQRARVLGLGIPKLPRSTSMLSKIDFALSQAALPWIKPQILHETYYCAKSLHARGAKRVLTVLDMIHEKFPESFSPADRTVELKKIAVARADHILCISESTKRDLMEILGVPEKKLSVVYLGHSFGDRSLNSQPLIASPYILFVGPRGGYKNFRLLLEVFTKNPSLYEQFTLVCAGGGQFTEEEKSIIGDKKVSQRFASDAELASLFRHAAAFVYPSMYEGFGIPPLEAMSAGCPVVCGNGGSLPEVTGEAAEIFDSRSEASLAAALGKVLFSEENSSRLRQKGSERVKMFSWSKCAEGTQKVYESIL